MSRREDEEDLALLRRLVIGLQADQASPRSPVQAHLRIDGARTLVQILVDRHPHAALPGSDWALAIEHVEQLCRAIERDLAAAEG
jgi:hypothetical protein